MCDHQLLADDRSEHWRKIGLLREVARQGYDKFMWLDTDCVIVDHDFNVMNAIGFGVGACECFDSPIIERHLNTGVLMFANSLDVRAFLDEWDVTPRVGNVWQDQSAFIKLMSARPNRDLLTILPNRFNCLDEHMEARDPFIRAFHGDIHRASKMEMLVREISKT
ncbi:hypothetical protein [Methylobacterium sp. D54C]